MLDFWNNQVPWNTIEYLTWGDYVLMFTCLQFIAGGVFTVLIGFIGESNSAIKIGSIMMARSPLGIVILPISITAFLSFVTVASAVLIYRAWKD